MDVEIIEDEDQIIEISDEEDCKSFLLNIEDVEEILYDVNVVEEENNWSQNNLINTVRAQSLNKTVSNNHCSSWKNNAPEAVTENVGTIKQENSVNRTMNRTVSNTNNSGNSKTIKRRRKRKSRQYKNLLRANKSNTSNNHSNGNVNSAIFAQESCSTNNKNLPARHDFSKLKWLQPLSNLSSPPHLQIVIIDRSHSDWRIETDKWLMVEKRLLEALNKEMLRSHDLSIGLFDGAKWQRGIKIVGCHNENAFNFIMKFIINLDKLWHGAQLDAFPISYLSRHVVKVYIPPPTIKTELIMSLIKLQNPLLSCNDWKVVRECERFDNGGIDIWISVNDQSFMQLSSLRGEIKYGINRLFVNPSR